MTLTILTNNCEFPEFKFNKPNGLHKGTYLAKCENELLFQLPILKSRAGIINTGGSKYIDLIIDNDTLVKELVNYLEKGTKEEIKKKQKLWFVNDLLEGDISYYFNDTIKQNILRATVPENLYVFNKDKENLEMSDIEGKDIICIVEFIGLRFTTTSFKLDFNVNQVMVYESRFEKCIVRRESINDETLGEDLENIVVLTGESDETTQEQMDDNNDDDNEDDNEDDDDDDDDNEDDDDEEDDDDDDEDCSSMDEITIDDLDDNEIIQLKKPNEIYKKNYYETYDRAKAAKQYAIKTFLEAKKIKQLHLLDDLESSDEDEVNFK